MPGSNCFGSKTSWTKVIFYCNVVVLLSYHLVYQRNALNRKEYSRTLLGRYYGLRENKVQTKKGTPQKNQTNQKDSIKAKWKTNKKPIWLTFLSKGERSDYSGAPEKALNGKKMRKRKSWYESSEMGVSRNWLGESKLNGWVGVDWVSRGWLGESELNG